MKAMQQTEVYWLLVPEEMTVEDVASRLDFLDAEERAVYDRYRVDFKKIEFLLGRALLKGLLGERLGLRPQEVAFRKNDYGKLFLARDEQPFHFNLTHSGRMIACVISPLQVGVDVEQGDVDHLSVMNSVFTPQEQEHVNQAPLATRLQAFFRIWTRKEAYVKAVGMGLSIPPDSFSVPIEEVYQAEWAYYTCFPADPYVLSLCAQTDDFAEPMLQRIEAYELLKS